MDNKEFIFKMITDIKDEIKDMKEQIAILKKADKSINNEELLETKINDIDIRLKMNEKYIGNIIKFCLSLAPEVPPTEDEIECIELAIKMQGDEPLVRHEDMNWD